MHGRRGIALVLVLTVLLALALVATPFVLSMVMQEKTASAFKATRMADYGSRGVRNYAVAWLVPGNDYMERGHHGMNPVPPFDTPFGDDFFEFAATGDDFVELEGQNFAGFGVVFTREQLLDDHGGRTVQGFGRLGAFDQGDQARACILEHDFPIDRPIRRFRPGCFWIVAHAPPKPSYTAFLPCPVTG